LDGGVSHVFCNASRGAWLCGLTVELSGVQAISWAWHFISHASAPARC
jgi:hypothetical protein